jgi:hypothetical protein
MKKGCFEFRGVDNQGGPLLEYYQQTRRASLLVRRNDAHFGGYFFGREGCRGAEVAG